MPPLPTHGQETIERARSLYREGARVRDICAATGMSVGTLYYHLDGSLPGLMPPRLLGGTSGHASAGAKTRGAAFRAASSRQKARISLPGLQRKEVADRPCRVASLRASCATFSREDARCAPARAGAAAGAGAREGAAVRTSGVGDRMGDEGEPSEGDITRIAKHASEHFRFDREPCQLDANRSPPLSVLATESKRR